MTKIRTLAVLCAILIISVARPTAFAEVRVQFVEPQHYIYAGRYGYDEERALKSIEGQLQALGKRCLAADQTLEIRIHNIDLAGQHEWWRPRGYDVRIMRGVTWPRMDLQYVWKDAGGAVLAQGHERVSDMEYLSRSACVRSDPDPLVYDKAMLTDWFERRFCRASG